MVQSSPVQYQTRLLRCQGQFVGLRGIGNKERGGLICPAKPMVVLYLRYREHTTEHYGRALLQSRANGLLYCTMLPIISCFSSTTAEAAASWATVSRHSPGTTLVQYLYHPDLRQPDLAACRPAANPGPTSSLRLSPLRCEPVARVRSTVQFGTVGAVY